MELNFGDPFVIYIRGTQKFTEKTMFGRLFTRKPINKIKEVDEAPVMVAEPRLPNLATMLILMMTSYVEQNERAAGQLVPVIKDVRTAYDRLLKLGMGQTQNARALQTQIEANDKADNDVQRAKALIRFVKEAQAHFGPRTVLVSYTAFDDLCKRYGLVQGILADYCGVIPERNVQDIENVMVKLPSFLYLNKINDRGDQWSTRHYIYVTGADLHSDHADLADFIKNHHNILEMKEKPSEYARYWHPKDISGYYYGQYGYLSKVYGVPLTHENLFIACPPEYLKNPGIKIQPKPVDPAIFQFTPYGILVHTIWGEEAEDAAFKHFMDVNLRIAQS